MDVSYNKLTGDLSILNKLANLEELWLAGNPSSGSFQHFQGLKKLIKLEIHGTKFDDGCNIYPQHY